MDRLAIKLEEIWTTYEENTISFSPIDEGIIVKGEYSYICKILFKKNKIIIVYDNLESPENKFVIYFLVKNLSVFFRSSILIDATNIEY